MVTTQANVQTLVKTLNADFFGVSDLSSAYDAILEQGGPVICGIPARDFHRRRADAHHRRPPAGSHHRSHRRA